MRQNCQLLTEFWLPSQPGNERLAMARVVDALAGTGLSERQLDRLKTAVSEATLNAIEHGNNFRPDRLVGIRVCANDADVYVTITDEGTGPPGAVDSPDLQEKLAGHQNARGWGLFLMHNMVDEVSDQMRDGRHTVVLRVHLTSGQLAG
jgi:serine/threonine-protein kinase RsbW